MKRQRSLKGIDPNRLKQASAGPGSDPRVWIAFGKVTDVAFDAESGGLAAVDIVGGPLDGEADVACSIAPGFGAQGAFMGVPLAIGTKVVLSIPEGDLNVDPQIIGVAIGPESKPPTSVAGSQIADRFGEAFILAAPEHEALLELSSIDGKLGNQLLLKVSQEARIDAGQFTAVSSDVRLAVADPQQAFVRGSAFTDALKTFLDSTDTFAGTVLGLSTTAAGACVGPLAPLAPFFSGLNVAIPTWRTGIAAFKATLIAGQALSTKIKGD